MKEKLNKFTNTRTSKNIFLLIIIFFIFIISSTLFFKSYKDKLIQNYNFSMKLDIKYLNSKLEKYIKNYKKEEVLKDINILVRKNFFKSITIKNTRYLFSAETLFENTENLEDRSWEIIEVVVDAKYGFIQKLPKSNLYEFIPSSNFNPQEPINLRYQLFKKTVIKNFFAKIDFSDIKIKGTEEQIKSTFLDFFMDIKSTNGIYELKLNNQIVSTVIYKYNNEALISKIEAFLIKLIFFNIILFLPVIFVLIFYHKYLFKKYVAEPIDYVNSYLDDILENKFRVLDRNKLEGTKEIKELTKKITKVSTKIVSLKNELNINKESLELKSSTDSLTGLPNKNIFDFDIKTMFVSKTKAYIFIIKMDKLSEISKKHDSGYINNFIESYTNSIRNVIFKYSKIDMKLYRFYGSQFAVIARNIDINTAKKMCEELISETTDILPDIYDVPKDLIQIGGVSFDLYGSLDTILNSLEDAYKLSKEKGINTYHIIGDEDIEKNYSLLDNSVVEVINKGDFTINYVLDSFLFDDPVKLVMSEASPQLYDHENKKLSIGSFVAVAQKLDLVDKFDKMVITKVIEEIKTKQFTQEIAINLSISSIENKQFMLWLEKILNENEDIKNNIVFSITSYTAYLHKETFEEFIKKVHKIGSKVLLKRYKTDEYPLTQLEFLELDYLRMSQDYTANFTNDVVKKHKVKNILIFAELNNIKVFSDNVKLDSDYDLLERLGTYGTSK